MEIKRPRLAIELSNEGFTFYESFTRDRWEIFASVGLNEVDLNESIQAIREEAQKITSGDLSCQVLLSTDQVKIRMLELDNYPRDEHLEIAQSLLEKNSPFKTFNFVYDLGKKNKHGYYPAMMAERDVVLEAWNFVTECNFKPVIVTSWVGAPDFGHGPVLYTGPEKPSKVKSHLQNFARKIGLIPLIAMGVISFSNEAQSFAPERPVARPTHGEQVIKPSAKIHLNQGNPTHDFKGARARPTEKNNTKTNALIEHKLSVAPPIARSAVKTLPTHSELQKPETPSKSSQMSVDAPRARVKVAINTKPSSKNADKAPLPLETSSKQAQIDAEKRKIEQQKQEAALKAKATEKAALTEKNEKKQALADPILVTQRPQKAVSSTMKDLSLLGVMGSPASRRILVQDKKGRVHRLEVGSRIDNWTVSKISSNSVYLTSGGKSQRLDLPSK